MGYRESWLEEVNYMNDHRTQAKNEYECYDRNSNSLLISFVHETEEGEEVEEKLVVPCEMEVCGTCGGTGSYVNPSIDASGLTAEDFADDPDFREDYFSGRYDMTCKSCGGNNVVPVAKPSALSPEKLKLWNIYQEILADDASYERECRMERMMGA